MTRLVEDPVLGQRYGFRRGVDEDGGEVLYIDTRVDPGGGVTPHLHPTVEERFTVLAGHPSFLAGREWRQTGPGDTVVVPAGVRHAYRNTGDEVAHLVCECRPPSTLQEFLEQVGALAREGKFTRRGLPKSPSGALDAIALTNRHRETVVLLFPPMPPWIVQRVLFPPLARLWERRHRRAPGVSGPRGPASLRDR